MIEYQSQLIDVVYLVEIIRGVPAEITLLEGGLLEGVIKALRRLKEYLQDGDAVHLLVGVAQFIASLKREKVVVLILRVLGQFIGKEFDHVNRAVLSRIDTHVV